MKKVRLSGIAYESLVNGPGLRRVFFTQGCKHNCKGCFNPETHDFEGGEEFDIDSLIEDVKNNPMIKGVTFSGGDPLEQGESFAYMAKRFKEIGLNIWVFTGYKFEYILENLDKISGWRELIENIDILVDGRFEEALKNDNLKFKGSSNQRIIDVKSSLMEKKVNLLEF
ncbi:anaerobic ribonucleoside-triphosphate reductase activating protein [Clostridium massiliamazoniense]|uniref:anaerobic ribonucleoside-triphosphate reductase activating protein n=1 Tax=Clostridium massiliamazoniense TaxID=1347366 RepID=UPI0006D7E1DE|nr:anaerobic ribonucleoside-triphosphate reductase activating protein [Clostridium massiliamazoniense]